MIDGLLSGLIGGLFGPAVAQWLSRFKYWAVFLVAMLLTQLLAVGVMLKRLGLEKTIKAFTDGIDPVFFYVPAGIGAMAVLVAFIGSLNVPKDSDSAGK
jgi:small-conductance mechanosensitive channel